MLSKLEIAAVGVCAVYAHLRGGSSARILPLGSPHTKRWSSMEILAAAHRTGGGGLLLALIALVVVMVAAAKILPKAGYSPWFALLLLVPVVGLVMILVFAFSDWPAEKELRRYRQGGYGPGSGGSPAPQWPMEPPPSYGSGGSQFPPPSWQTPPAGSAPQSPGSAPPWPGTPPPSAPPPAAPPSAPPPWPGGSDPPQSRG
jgi:hypothetical protein